MFTTPRRGTRLVDLTPDDWAEIHLKARRLRAEAFASLLRSIGQRLAQLLHLHQPARTVPR